MFPCGEVRFKIFMLEGMTMEMIFAAVVFRHEPTVRWTMPFQALPNIGHRIKVTLGGKPVIGVVECVEHDTDKINSIETHPIAIHCVQIAEADSDVQNS